MTLALRRSEIRSCAVIASSSATIVTSVTTFSADTAVHQVG